MDSGFTPYIAVSVDEHTLVPPDFVRAGEIVLNISGSATNRLEISNELIQFQARFNGQAQDLSIPIDNVSAIYARENGHGMAFDVPKAMALVADPDEQGESSTVRLVTPDVTDEPLGNLPEDDDIQSLAPPQRSRPVLTAVPGPVSVESAPESGSDSGGDDDPDPDGDGAAGSADNGGGAARKPRGKPKLTRVK